jgi:hypothetical protein
VRGDLHLYSPLNLPLSYGPNGASVIESEILAMLVPKEELSRTVYHTVQQTLRSDPRNRFDGYDAVFDFREFVTFVLTPSVATMLIQEDTGMVYSISVANAIRRATSILDGVTDVSFSTSQRLADYNVPDFDRLRTRACAASDGASTG